MNLLIDYLFLHHNICFLNTCLSPAPRPLAANQIRGPPRRAPSCCSLSFCSSQVSLQVRKHVPGLHRSAELQSQGEGRGEVLQGLWEDSRSGPEKWVRNRANDGSGLVGVDGPEVLMLVSIFKTKNLRCLGHLETIKVSLMSHLLHVGAWLALLTALRAEGAVHAAAWLQ